MKISHVLKTIPLVLLLLALLPAADAAASASQVTIVQDDTELLGRAPAQRDSRLDEMKSLGADVVKFRLDWRSLAPSPRSKKKPSGFSGSDPAQYRAANWSRYDGLIRAIVARGLRPYVMLGGRAPRWASGKQPYIRPNAGEFKRFVQAVGTRYSGSYGSPLDPLPRVTLWSAWNEPNLIPWLGPQYAHKRPVSPGIYRRLVYGAQDGLSASGHGGDQLLIGELLPFARGGRTGGVKVRPLTFIREMACVNRHYRPYRGKAARVRGCTHFRKIPGTGLAYHPYTLAGGPDVRMPNRDDASMKQLGRVLHALDKLSKRKRLVSHRMPLWIAEFGFQTAPPDRYQSPIKRVPGFMGEAEWLAFRSPRVASYAQYPFVDDRMGRGGAGFQSGIRFHNGKKKPGVYNAFRLPLFVKKRSSKVVEVFGGVRAGHSGDSVTIESKRGKGKFRKLGTAVLNSQGYFDRVFKVSGAARRHYRFRSSAGSSRKAGVHR